MAGARDGSGAKHGPRFAREGDEALYDFLASGQRGVRFVDLTRIFAETQTPSTTTPVATCPEGYARVLDEIEGTLLEQLGQPEACTGLP